jgi:hypothetical protein
MICSYCKIARTENEAPCPHCGAPSPLLQVSQAGQWRPGNVGTAAWNNESTNTSSNAARSTYQNPSWQQDTSFNTRGQQVEQQNFASSSFRQPSGQLNFPASTPSFRQPSGQLNFPTQTSSFRQPSGQLNFPATSPGEQTGDMYSPMPFWQQADGPAPVPSQELGSSFLPVPYQNGELQAESRQPTVSLQLVPDNAIEHLIPVEQQQAPVVYVPPMYTKPRPIIPQKRAISGFLSVIIVALLLCSGLSYYAKASGWLDRAVAFYTGKPGPNLPASTANNIPNPPNQKTSDLGPAYNNGTIPSATFASRIDQHNVAIAPSNIFKPNQTFYLTFTVNTTNQAGKVFTKWYTNGRFFETVPQTGQAIPAKSNKSASIPMQFSQPLSGYVEIYWNNQFAERLYFAVRY